MDLKVFSHLKRADNKNVEINSPVVYEIISLAVSKDVIENEFS